MTHTTTVERDGIRIQELPDDVPPLHGFHCYGDGVSACGRTFLSGDGPNRRGHDEVLSRAITHAREADHQVRVYASVALLTPGASALNAADAAERAS